MKLTHKSAEVVSVSPDGALSLRVRLAADVPGAVRVEFMLDPSRDAAFVQDGERASVISTEVHAGPAVTQTTAALALVSETGTWGRDGVPLVVRFDPRGGIDPEEIYLEISIPLRS